MSADAIIGQKRGYNISAPGANTNIFSTDVTPVYSVSLLRITVALGTASVFNVYVTSGATSFTFGLNSSAALAAGDLYTFDFPINNACTYNFRVETDGVIQNLQVDEVPGGVA